MRCPLSPRCEINRIQEERLAVGQVIIFRMPISLLLVILGCSLSDFVIGAPGYIMVTAKSQASENVDHRAALGSYGSAIDSLPDTLSVFVTPEVYPTLLQCDSLSEYEERKRCSDQLILQTIYSHMRWPQALQEWCGEGSIVVSFVVTKEGTVAELRVVRSLHPLLDEEVTAAISLLNLGGPAFRPGMMYGKPIRTQMTIPIRIRLD